MKNILFTLFLLFGLAATGLSQNVESVLIRIHENSNIDKESFIEISIINNEGTESKTFYNGRKTEVVNKNVLIKSTLDEWIGQGFKIESVSSISGATTGYITTYYLIKGD